ncbi:MAG: MATE family efflux transporter [Synechococcus sp.]
MHQNLTQGSVGPQLAKLTLPMVWGVFAIIAFNLVDTLFVARLGTDELAAMSFTFPVVTVLGSVSMGLGTGTSSVVARAIGEGDRQKVKRLTTNSLTLSVLIVAVLVGIGLLTLNPLFRMLGADETLLPFIRDYMLVWYLGMVFLVVPMVGNSAIRAAGNTAIPSAIMTVSAGVNILLDPMLIFGFGPIPAMELQGAALATVIARATTLVASLLVLHFRERMLLLCLPTWETVQGCWRSILTVGIPASASNVVSPVAIGFITSLMAGYGPTAVAGFGIASRVESFSLIAILALTASIGPFVGQNWGAKAYDRVITALNLSFRFCAIYGLTVAVILAAYALPIAQVFNSNPDVTSIARLYLTIVPVTYMAAGAIYIASSTFNALGMPLPSLAMTFSRMLVFYVPLAYLGSWLFDITGVFLAGAIANAIVGLGALLWSRSTCSLRHQEIQPLSISARN